MYLLKLFFNSFILIIVNQMLYLFKIVLCSNLLFLVCEVNAQSTWTRLNSPVSVALRNSCFVDNLNGWAAGDDGIIVHTSNGGDTFEIQILQ